jgi:transcriptional regulator with XRE-family HTH domain
MTYSDYFNLQELKRAYLFWLPYYKFLELEKDLEPFLCKDLRAAVFPVETFRGGWLKQSREAAFISAEEAARRCGLTRSSYGRIEEREADGNVTLANLAKAAEGLNCELVYAIRPKSRQLFSHQIFKTLVKAVDQHSWLRNCDQRRRAMALAGLAATKMADPEFKRTQNWSQKSNRL